MAVRVSHSWNEFRPFFISRTEYMRYQMMIDDNINLALHFKEGYSSFRNTFKTMLIFFLMLIFGGITQWGLFSLIVAIIGICGLFGMAVRFGALLMYDLPSELKRKKFWKYVEIDIQYAESHFKTLSRADKYKFSLNSPYDIFLGRQKQRYPNLIK